MEFNENVLKGKWNEIKGNVQNLWGRLTDDELEKTKGDMKAIGGLIQQKYGNTQANYKEKLSEIFQNFSEAKDEFVGGVKEELKH